jgi:hypothetical protein
MYGALLKDARLLFEREVKALEELENIYPLVQAGHYYLFVQKEPLRLT